MIERACSAAGSELPYRGWQATWSEDLASAPAGREGRYSAPTTKDLVPHWRAVAVTALHRRAPEDLAPRGRAEKCLARRCQRVASFAAPHRRAVKVSVSYERVTNGTPPL